VFFVSGKKPPPDVDANGVFATTELDLKEVDVYGFDYDYTLAHYKESVDHLIYNLGREVLVKKLKVSLLYLLSIKFVLFQLFYFSILNKFLVCTISLVLQFEVCTMTFSKGCYSKLIHLHKCSLEVFIGD
jgi:5' nucleotidase family